MEYIPLQFFHIYVVAVLSINEAVSSINNYYYSFYVFIICSLSIIVDDINYYFITLMASNQQINACREHYSYFTAAFVLLWQFLTLSLAVDCNL